MESGREELQEILDNLDMEDYLDREAIEYRNRHGSSGPQLNVRSCPACGDDRWKVYLNAETGLGNCFHGDCHQGTFNKWSFIKAHLGVEENRVVIDHIKRVAAEFGWRPHRPRLPKPLASPIGERLGERQLPSNTILLPDSSGAHLAYLEERGITADLAAEFGLGYCHAGRYTYKDSAGEERWQSYKERVVIPIYDLDGQLVTFQGRDITGSADNKYIFPPMLPSSGAYLYHGHRAVGAGEAVLCEGVFDVISVHAAFRDDRSLCDVAAVGSFGMHLSNTQLDAFRTLKEKGLKRLVIMWDGEPRATKKAREAAERLVGIGLNVRVGLLGSKDPNDSTPEEIKRAFYGAVNPMGGAGLQEVLRKSLGM